MTTETPLNRGAELLREAGSISEVAAELGVTPRVVSAWRAGQHPSDDNQSALQAAFGIPRRAWREYPTNAEPGPRQRRSRTPEPHWSIPQHTPWLTFGHPLAALTVRRLAIAPTATAEEMDALDADTEALRQRHHALVAAVERAELALGLALAAENPDDDSALRFLRSHGDAVSSTPAGGVGAKN